MAENASCWWASACLCCSVTDPPRAGGGCSPASTQNAQFPHSLIGRQGDYANPQ
ncbi:hypothetical protein ACFPRL_29450 [Pseudoclavibacter helvolus]